MAKTNNCTTWVDCYSQKYDQLPLDGTFNASVNADFNEERTNKRNVPSTVDFNRSCASEFGQESNFRSGKSEGGTKSKVEGLISQFQEFAKVSSKQSR